MAILFFVSLCASAQEYLATGNSKTDFVNTFHLILKGSHYQFKESTNLYYAGAMAPTLYYSFQEDKRISRSLREKPISKHYQLTSDLAIALNFPILPIGIYYLGKSNLNKKTMNFAMEYAAALYLTLAETALLSFIPVHERPTTADASFWETQFRGKSSFPSGHIIPYTTLFFKTLQFYGPIWAVIPGVLTYWTSAQRIQDGRHYLSDIVGAIFLTAFASEGVRAANKHDQNDPFYKYIFEHDLRITLLRENGVNGVRVAFSY